MQFCGGEVVELVDKHAPEPGGGPSTRTRLPSRLSGHPAKPALARRAVDALEIASEQQTQHNLRNRKVVLLQGLFELDDQNHQPLLVHVLVERGRVQKAEHVAKRELVFCGKRLVLVRQIGKRAHGKLGKVATRGAAGRACRRSHLHEFALM